MDRCRLLVEGQTEETFANMVLLPYLADLGFHDVSVTVVQTKRIAGGEKYRGGVVSWTQLRTDIRLLLRDAGALVTTMVDYYALPRDVPGVSDVQPSWDARRGVAHVEAAMAAAVDRPNFLPNVILHEFEALLYSDPAAVGAHFDDDGVTASMKADLAECMEPELVDDGPTTAPSKRIMAHHPRYLKTTHGPRILADIGLPSIRGACPKFGEWLSRIEDAAPG